jgi:eukaryotic-like serine/threonine-protein kinase
MPLPVGSKLGPYEILAKIGEGGMGEVYKARDTRLDRVVAIKVLPPEKTADPERKRRFIQEAKAASALNHPNIVTIHDIGSENGTDFIVMEFVSGKTLDRLIPRNGMRLHDALVAVIPVADALAKAHANGIVHRDLKPGNIMISDEGTPKLLDFGLAKLVENVPAADMIETEEMSGVGRNEPKPNNAPLTEEGAILGTVAYMSPEQAEGKTIDARSDIFSFGSVFYEMLTGRKAFQGESRVATLAAILHHEPKPLSDVTDSSNSPGIPRELERMITRCLRKDPSKRWQSIADLRTSLQEFKEDSDSGLTRSAVHPTATAAAPTRSHKLAWGIAVVVVIAAVGIAFWAIRGTSTPTEELLKAVPLTSYPGNESAPALSPDGTQVAFAWQGEKLEDYDIYVKRMGPGPPLRLTRNPADDVRPAWSPDGGMIAFLRDDGSGNQQVILIPALGGPERVFVEVHQAIAETSGISWSADGKWLAAGDRPENAPAGLWLYSLETGQRKRLTTVPSGEALDDGRPAISPDGKSVAFVRSTGPNARDLFVVALTQDMDPAGPPKRLTMANQNAQTPAWTGDGRQLLFPWGVPGASSIFRVSVDGASPPKLLKELSGEYVNAVTYAWHANRLVYEDNKREIDIYRAELNSGGGEAREIKPLIVSSRLERHPAYSPDGKKIAFSSLRSGVWQVWVADADGSNPVQLTSFDRGESRVEGWSPDGQKIGFTSDADGDFQAYTVAANGGRPEKLDSLGRGVTTWFWSRDGKWIIYRLGSNDVRRVPVAGGPSTLLARSTAGVYLTQSPDGKLIYFAQSKAGVGAVWSVPTDGGEERKILDTDMYVSLAVASNGLYLTAGTGGTTPGKLMFYRFPNGPLKEVPNAGPTARFGLSLSPDGKYLLYNKQTATGSDLMLVENFK